MKNIKKVLLSAVITITAITHHSKMHSIFDKAAGVAMAEKFDEVLAKHMPKLEKLGDTLATSGPEMSKVALSDASKELSKGIVEASSKFGAEAAKTLAPALDIAAKAAGVGVLVYGTYTLATTVSDVYNYYNPDKEKQERIHAASEAVDLLKARRGFRDCLTNNARTPRNDEGLPTVCDKFSQTFRMVAGQAAFNEMTTNFKNAYKG